jgi:hypothetical protein
MSSARFEWKAKQPVNSDGVVVTVARIPLGAVANIEGGWSRYDPRNAPRQAS